jgi:hypothetical protein
MRGVHVVPIHASWMEWPSEAQASNAAGYAGAERDFADCLRIRSQLVHVIRPLPLENPPEPDAWFGFVTGDIRESDTPLCGETRVFHHESREILGSG